MHAKKLPKLFASLTALFLAFLHSLKAGMRSYFNGGGSTSSATPPPSLSGRTRGSTGQIIGARSSSASLPRSPESDLQAMINVAGGSSGSGQGSLGSHGSNQEVYVNIYQNTNHPSLFVSFCFPNNDFSSKKTFPEFSNLIG